MKHCLVVLIIFCLSACSVKWYHPVKGEGDFAKDRAECEVMAKIIGQNASHTGRRIEPNAYYKALQSCLYQKGWSLGPPQAETAEEHPSQDNWLKR